jgi:excisionase family DNA binding protein
MSSRELEGVRKGFRHSAERVESHIGGMGQLDPLLSVRDLAEYLRLPIGTLYAWRCRGQGPSGFRVGRHVRYRQSDVDLWIDAQVAEERSDLTGTQEHRAAS